MCFPSSAPHVWEKFHFWRNLSDMARHPSGVVEQVITSGMHSSMMAWQTSLTTSDWVLWGTLIRTSWLNRCSQRQGDAKSVRASGQAPGAPCTRCVVWWSWDPLWLAGHRTSRGASAWSSWRIFGPRFGAPPEAGRRDQTAVACRPMVSPKLHVFFFFSSFFWFCYLESGELPNRSDHAGVGEELPPSSLVGGPRRTEEELEMGA